MEITKEKLIDYFLHKLSPAEREEIEILLMTDFSLFEKVEVVEMELIDDYLDATLSPEDSQLFREKFLAGDERFFGVRLTKALKRVAQREASLWFSVV